MNNAEPKCLQTTRFELSARVAVLVLLASASCTDKPKPDPLLAEEGAGELEQVSILEVLAEAGEDPVTIFDVALSPDGTRLLVAGGRDLQIWDVAERRLQTTLQSSGQSMGWAEFCGPDRVCGATANEIYVWDRSTHEQKLVFTDPDIEWIEDIKLNPTDPSQVVVATRGDIWSVSIVDGSKRRLPIDGTRNTMIAVSPDGTRVLTQTSKGELVLGGFDATAKMRRRKVADAYPRGVNAFSFSPDGKTIAVAVADRVELWNAKTLRPRKRQRLAIGAGHLAFSPGGDILLVAERSDIRRRESPVVRLFGLPGLKPMARIEGLEMVIDHTAFSPDGKTIAIANLPHHHVTLWDIESQSAVATLECELQPRDHKASPR